VAMTRRGKIAAAVLTVLLVGGAGAGTFLFLNSGGDGGNALAEADENGNGVVEPTELPDERCPLTGVLQDGPVPDRSVLAIKVEEAAEARPQAGLNEADIVYEQPVEGNITRLIAVYHCQDAVRVGPVRSARFMDPNLLPQFGTPLFGYSGAAREVVQKVEAADVVDLSFEGPAVGSYERDPAREMPHNLFTSTENLYREGGTSGGEVRAVFSYREQIFRGERARSIHLPFNEELADIVWRWNQSARVWERFHSEEPHVDEAGTQITAVNVVVQVVELIPTDIVDTAGNPSSEVVVIGSGEAFVFRNGRVIEGTWRKRSPQAPTKFFGRGGREIPLAPGNTWVELFNNTLPIGIE
jgi:hypothetical protein